MVVWAGGGMVGGGGVGWGWDVGVMVCGAAPAVSPLAHMALIRPQGGCWGSMKVINSFNFLLAVFKVNCFQHTKTQVLRLTSLSTQWNKYMKEMLCC